MRFLVVLGILPLMSMEPPEYLKEIFRRVPNAQKEKKTIDLVTLEKEVDSQWVWIISSSDFYQKCITSQVIDWQILEDQLRTQCLSIDSQLAWLSDQYKKSVSYQDGIKDLKNNVLSIVIQNIDSQRMALKQYSQIFFGYRKMIAEKQKES